MKSEKQLIAEMLEKNKENLMELKIDERYFQRKALEDKKFLAKVAGLQDSLKLQEDYIKFLEEIEKE